MNIRKIVSKLLLFAVALTFTACPLAKSELTTKTSQTTGWKDFNDVTAINFLGDASSFAAGPVGMLPIPGGVYKREQSSFITAPNNSQPINVTVDAFYMDKYEVTNIAWREYLKWNEVVFKNVRPDLLKKLLPDTTVWRENLGKTDKLEKFYFRHPAYNFYPVVGVTWDQAMDYCQWRTDRVNEAILVTGKYMEQAQYGKLYPMNDTEIQEFFKEHGFEDIDISNSQYTMVVKLPLSVAQMYDATAQPGSDGLVELKYPSYDWIKQHFVFNTDKYLHGGIDEYNPKLGDAAPMNAHQLGPRKLNSSDGILVLGYRLPTELEWEYAAKAKTTEDNGILKEGRTYPWSGDYPRTMSDKNQGKMLANFTRGDGELVYENDKDAVTARVDAFEPNDFGLYNMAGNVNEWVLDVYRETSFEDMTSYNGFRGNVYKEMEREAGKLVLTEYGTVKYKVVDGGDVRNYRDGDAASLFDETDYPLVDDINKLKDPTDILIPRVNDSTRVYKGGSWKDRVYWLDPTTRRFKQQDECSSTIGFRCAMDKLPSAE